MNKKIIEKFIQKTADQITGSWVLVGGSVLPLLGASDRFTQDIDIAGPEKSTQRDSLTLMKIAESLGLPVESINQGASFFLRKIPMWQNSLVLVYEGKKGKIFRPNVTLYIQLKLGRFSQTDYEDCSKMLLFAKQHEEELDPSRVIKTLKKELSHSQNKLKKSRLESFLRLLEKEPYRPAK